MADHDSEDDTTRNKVARRAVLCSGPQHNIALKSVVPDEIVVLWVKEKGEQLHGDGNGLRLHLCTRSLC